MSSRVIRSALILDQEDAINVGRALAYLDRTQRRAGGALAPALREIMEEIAANFGNSAHIEQATDECVRHEFIDVEEAAHILSCSPRNVRDLATRGRLPGRKLAGRWQFLRAEVEQLRDFGGR
ncbi:helix-turn-helix domain-containing protein [Corynebacterium fournieri]|uniref:helix-turn-helix domain-containing protein n=1 Tax=Corynebacterium fournieri TaxID=1852390 RepID=UPI001E43E34F|nr:helix-turn-helix domain-containing protein [Corynebacterium fournieri]WJY97193.1 Helix-turn-helix domain protein [Corynebacterium fournieri]